MATLVLALILVFDAPLRAASLPFWGWGKKEYPDLGGRHPFGACGWALVGAHIDLKMRFAFQWCMIWTSKYGKRGSVRGGRGHCRKLLRMHTIGRRRPGGGTTATSVRYVWGGCGSIALGGWSEHVSKLFG